NPNAVAPRPHQARLRQQAQMMRRVCKRLPNLSRNLVHGPLALRQHIDNLSPPSAAKRLGDRREGVKEGILCHAITHTLKLSFDYWRFKVPIALRTERSLDPASHSVSNCVPRRSRAVRSIV